MQDKENNSPPKLISLEEYDGDWPTYLEIIYNSYLDTVANARLTYNGLPISCQRKPIFENKGAGFWHTISEGESEQDRTADLRRCERIQWIAWVITQIKTNSCITCWENQRGANTHVVLLYEKESYVVVLAKRSNYYLLKTAYCATERRLQKLVQERDKYCGLKKTEGAG